MALMTWKAGGYSHTPGTVRVSNFSLSNEKRSGQIIGLVIKCAIEGTIFGSSQAQIDSRSRDLINAYSQPLPFVGLFRADGGKTHIYIPGDNALAPGIFVTPLEFPDGQGADFATYHRFRISFEAHYAAGNLIGSGLPSENYLQLDETLSFTGDGGPRYSTRECQIGPPYRELVRDHTICRARQSGRASARGQFPPVPAPLFPEFLDHDSVSIERESIRSFTNGQPDEYPVRWSYSYTSPEPLG